jgi:hypothetical protein
MKGFHRYFSGFVLGIAVVFGLLFALAYYVQGAAPEAGRWTAEILAKKRELATAKNPKLLILAGSNALFGFSAERIEREYGVPAVNLSSHAGLGLRYLLEFARPFVKPGVIIVLPLEYRFYGPLRLSQTNFLHFLGYDPAYFRGLPLAQQIDVLTATEWTGWARMLKARLIGDARRSDGYQLSTINDYGDETANRVEDRNPHALLRLAAIKGDERFALSADALAAIEEFARYAADHNARVVVTFPNILKNAIDFDVNRGFFDELRRRLASSNVALIGSPQANVFGLDHALDTPNHQTREGQIAATDRLMADLKRAGLI